MNKTILFSPVGGTDPISATNYRDGSLLHICRVFQPDKVYLYMSYEMLQFQEKDDRYMYCLHKLEELQHRTMEYQPINREELKNVQTFDYFYEDFRTIIKGILEEMDDTDTLLLNISSGTPAMKSGLLVLTTLGEFPCKSVQVTTPEKTINEHHHKEYDVETLWELNEDNSDDFENRCEIVKCPTLSLLKNEEIIKKHILAYDYAAALEVAKTLPVDKTEKYIELVQMAQARYLLDFKTSDIIAKKYQLSCFPVQSGNEKKYYEYTLNLDVKLKKKEYADFLRGITPIIADLFEMLLLSQAKIKIDDYCTIRNGVRKWDEQKVKNTKVEEALNNEFTKFDYKSAVYSIHLVAIINYMVQDAHIKTLVQELRSVEDSIRNLAAHEIISVTEDTIRTKTGFTSKTIIDKIKECFSYTKIKIKREYWDAYEIMNSEIIDRM